MQKENLIQKVSRNLLELSTKFATDSHCYGVWGEVELPENFRKELEEEQNNVE